MSQTTAISPRPGVSVHRFLAERVAGYRRYIARLEVYRERARSRRDLAEFDAYMLRDIGISEADRQAEIAKRFWEE